MSGLYVHVPFCARACPYCDFDFEVGRSPSTKLYLAGLEAELRGRPEIRDREYRTLYLGGGTPSLLGADGLGELLAWITRSFPGAGVDERTVELNPEHVTEGLLDTLIAGGVDRISLGIQTLDPQALAQLGRVHTARIALEAVTAALGRGLRVTADLIVGWPGQTQDSLRADIAGLLGAGVGHVSIYALTIEDSTPWVKLVRRGLRVLPDGDVQGDMLELSEQALLAAGLEHYEIASYAKPGQEARHNLLYWTWEDYVGLGPSAASATFTADGVVRRSNPRGLAAWGSGGDPQIDALGPEEAAQEGLWIGLRLLRGIEVDTFLRAFPGVDRRWIERRVELPLRRGNVEWTGEGRVLRVHPRRWLWHDTVGEAILG